MWRIIYRILYLFFLPIILINERKQLRQYYDFKSWLWQKLGRNINLDENPKNHNFDIKQNQIIWLHGVSLGEINTAILIINKWWESQPHQQFLLTSHTATGANAAREFIANLADKSTDFDKSQQMHFRLSPLDMPFAINNFCDNYKPQALFLIESDLWPSISWVCAQRKIPFLIVNARVSPKTAKRINLLKKLSMAKLFNPPQAIIAQNQDMAKSWQWLATNIYIGGQIKYDINVVEDKVGLGKTFREYLLTDNNHKKILIFASTREGEEDIALSFWQCLSDNLREKYILAIIPRHPERIEKVGNLIIQSGFNFQKRSDINNEKFQSGNIWLGDSLGEMFAYYASANIVVNGGSLCSYGGQNPIEAFAIGVPFIFGPYSYNFAKVRQDAINQGAALGITQNEAITKTALVEALTKLIEKIANNENLQNQMKTAQKKLIEQNRGALEQTINLIRKNIL